ncbi:MAG TPA: DNA polymerase Y family protein [Ideonella sp.]|jgi:protein ImuB|nr:DNA polymerase Y family protein [Ideonella sp.]
MLWLGLHLPSLSLESFCALLSPSQADQPVAMLAQHRIVAANAAARARGVRPGMRRATALALAPELQLGMAEEAREAEALRRVAHVLLAFTPTVVLAPPDSVVAELHASLRCFGGAARLWQRVADALAPLGHHVQRAHAPTALGAELLARWRDDPEPPMQLTREALYPAAEAASPSRSALHASEPMPSDPAWAELHRRLADLPAAWLVSEPVAMAQLEAMGLRSVAELRRQPRAGLARRFGPALLSALDQAWGLAPDPREPIAPPLQFHSQIELWARADNTEALLCGAAVLLGRLLAWAQARHARVQAFRLVLHHESRLRENAQGRAGAHLSQLDVALSEPTGDARHLQAVLRERLAREPLAAPVLSLGLVCDAPVLGPPPDGELFPSLAGQREGLMRLVERLQARLGSQAVHALAVQADHRPERATARQAIGAAAPCAEPPLPAERMTRPVWLLPEPRPLRERESRPWLDGQPLHLLSGPERIETGWWDGDLVSRDYFVAQAAGSAPVWVYRLRPAPPPGEPGWFLHGWFG